MPPAGLECEASRRGKTQGKILSASVQRCTVYFPLIFEMFVIKSLHKGLIQKKYTISVLFKVYYQPLLD